MKYHWYSASLAPLPKYLIQVINLEALYIMERERKQASWFREENKVSHATGMIEEETQVWETAWKGGLWIFPWESHGDRRASQIPAHKCMPCKEQSNGTGSLCPVVELWLQKCGAVAAVLPWMDTDSLGNAAVPAAWRGEPRGLSRDAEIVRLSSATWECWEFLEGRFGLWNV